jgi:hypothetical protein
MPKTKKNKDDREEIITKEIKKSFKDDPIYDKETSEDIETYQNDRTISPDPRMFKQLPEEQLLKYQAGGMSCPYRRKGAKSSIQGVKDIQLKGGKFIGCK